LVEQTSLLQRMMFNNPLSMDFFIDGDDVSRGNTLLSVKSEALESLAQGSFTPNPS